MTRAVGAGRGRIRENGRRRECCWFFCCNGICYFRVKRRTQETLRAQYAEAVPGVRAPYVEIQRRFSSNSRAYARVRRGARCRLLLAIEQLCGFFPNVSDREFLHLGYMCSAHQLAAFTAYCTCVSLNLIIREMPYVVPAPGA